MFVLYDEKVKKKKKEKKNEHDGFFFFNEWQTSEKKIGISALSETPCKSANLSVKHETTLAFFSVSDVVGAMIKTTTTFRVWKESVGQRTLIVGGRLALARHHVGRG